MDQGINTVFNVNIDYVYASLGDRIKAAVIDALIKMVYMILVVFIGSAIIGGVTKFENSGVAIFIMVILILPIFFYSFLFEAFNDGQTPGKKSSDIKVVSSDGTSAPMISFFIRWVFRLIDISIYSGAVGIISIAASKKKQRLGDMAAGTVVIKTKSNSTLKKSTFQIVDENHIPKYSSVINLNSSDIEKIKTVLNAKRNDGRKKAIGKLAVKVAEMMEVTIGDINPERFLRDVVKDFYYYDIGYDAIDYIENKDDEAFV